jgi:hypothetical protein
MIDYAPTGYHSGDCMINYQEFVIMAGDWLMKDKLVLTTDPDIADGLEAYYPMTEGTGNTTADFSGNGHDGVFSSAGVGWTSPGVMDNNAIDVDGAAGRRVSLGNWNPAGPNGLTLSIWLKWAGSHNHSQGLISKRDGWSSTGLMFMFELDTGGENQQLAFRQFSGGVWSPFGTMAPFIGKWVHAAATFDGTTARIYLNGREVASGPFSFAGGTGAGVTIGNTNSTSWSDCPETFNGELDEVRIYNRALSPSEIAFLADTTPEDGEVYTSLSSVAELYDAEAKGFREINFRDFAILVGAWLDCEVWP